MKDELVQILLEKLEDESGARVTYASIEVWHAILVKFSTLIGSYGASSLFKYCLESTRRQLKWIPLLNEGDMDNDVLRVLADALLLQPDDEVKRAMRLLFGTYVDALFSLIGSTLTVKFICDVGSKHFRTR